MPKPLDLARLATVQLVPLTPFSADGSRLLPDALETHIREMFEAGIRVFLPAAGTSEFHSLTVEEIVASVQATKRAVGDKAVVIGPVGLGLPHALAAGRGALEAGADGLLVMPPVHPYLSDTGLRDYFQVLLDSLPLPLLAYKKGPFPSDALLLDLAHSGKLAGVKYAVNEMDAVVQFGAALDPRCGLYCGTAERFAPFYAVAGAKGYTSGAGNLCPRLTLAMHRALSASNYADAMRILSIFRPIEDYRARSADSYNVSMLKHGMKIKGRDFGPPRPPQRRLTPAEEAEIREIVQPILAAEGRE